MTVAAGAVTLNLIHEGLSMKVLSIVMKKQFSLKTRVKTSYSIYDQIAGQNQYPIYDENG